MDMFDEKEKVRVRLQKLQIEKNYYLGEFKEKIIIAVKREELDGKISQKILELMKRKDAVLLKINRQIDFKNIREYLKYAEKIGLNYRLVDGISFSDEIGMVLVSNQTFNNGKENILLESKEEIYTQRGLCSIYAKYEGKKLCKKHFNLLKSNFPEKIENFSEIKVLDKLLGEKCPICQEKGEKNNEC